eukprot:TRINITY_DN1464_c0_g1_i1.p1 TRINITY_DN1464_c0_g1~~TRINITY_DN1464_c0_g1_i1.p1  ORF type:complete len:410 (+),score=35.87 TRINITY_DN1464_c0_g1_i1:141-1370(+)
MSQAQRVLVWSGQCDHAPWCTVTDEILNRDIEGTYVDSTAQYGRVLRIYHVQKRDEHGAWWETHHIQTCVPFKMNSKLTDGGIRPGLGPETRSERREREDNNNVALLDHEHLLVTYQVVIAQIATSVLGRVLNTGPAPARVRRAARPLSPEHAQEPAARVAVLGCGGGATVEWLARWGKGHVHVTAVDHDSRILKLAREYFGLGQSAHGRQAIRVDTRDIHHWIHDSQRAGERYSVIIVDLNIQEPGSKKDSNSSKSTSAQSSENQGIQVHSSPDMLRALCDLLRAPMGSVPGGALVVNDNPRDEDNADPQSHKEDVLESIRAMQASTLTGYKASVVNTTPLMTNTIAVWQHEASVSASVMHEEFAKKLAPVSTAKGKGKTKSKSSSLYNIDMASALFESSVASIASVA